MCHLTASHIHSYLAPQRVKSPSPVGWCEVPMRDRHTLAGTCSSRLRRYYSYLCVVEGRQGVALTLYVCLQLVTRRPAVKLLTLSQGVCLSFFNSFFLSFIS